MLIKKEIFEVQKRMFDNDVEVNSLTDGEFKVYYCILDNCIKGKRVAFISMKTIATQLCVSSCTISKWVSGLVSKNYVKYVKNGHKGGIFVLC